MAAPVSSPAPAVTLGRCNPYGAESGGPKRVLGGLYGPQSATTPDMHLPDAVAQGEWTCPQPAVVRCRMVCRCGHKGQIMALCSWHDEINWRGEYVGGIAKQVSEPIRVRGHYEEIKRRQSRSCPRCLYPSPGTHLEVGGRAFTHYGTDYAQLQKQIEHLAWDLAIEHAGGRWHGPRAREIRQLAEDTCKLMDEGVALGIIHRCPLTLEAVSLWRRSLRCAHG